MGIDCTCTRALGAPAGEPWPVFVREAEVGPILRDPYCPIHGDSALARRQRWSVRIYVDFRDWWIGYYRGDEHHYVCVLPCLVIRWPRGARADDR